MARRASLHRPSAVKKEEQAKMKFSSKYALTDMMVCGECGQRYRRQLWSKYGKKTGVWWCENRLKHGTKMCKYSPTLKEEPLQAAIMATVNGVVKRKKLEEAEGRVWRPVTGSGWSRWINVLDRRLVV